MTGNYLTRTVPKDTSLTVSDLQYYNHPLDVLWQINPEIGSLAYAHKEKIIDSELLPYIAQFRNLQSEEKIVLLKEITNRLAIGSDERKNEVVERTKARITELETNGKISIESIKSNTLVQTEQIKYNGEANIESIKSKNSFNKQFIKSKTALEIQKLKYETNEAIIEQQGSVQKYLSDNQLKATYKESEALLGIIKTTEELRADVENKKTEANLIEKITKAEVLYLSKIQEAETIRYQFQKETNMEIVKAYLYVQATIIREGMKLDLYKEKTKGNAEKSSYEALESIANKGMDVLKNKDAKSMEFKGKTPYGNINFDIKVEDE